MLALMGYQTAVRIRKSRVKTQHKNWEICIDEVEGLGSFIELEELADEHAEVSPIHTAMHEFLQAIGVEPEDAGLKRYDILLLEKAEAS